MSIFDHFRVMASFVFAGFTILFVLNQCCSGLPVTSCPRNYNGNFYIADHVDKCLYYWCLGGQRIGSALRCPPGTGVRSFHRSNRNPCQINVLTCSRFGPNFGMDRSTPVPSTRASTIPAASTTPGVTPPTPTTTATTESEMTTADDVITTEEMTGEPGSGDGEDLIPVDVTTADPSDMSGGGGQSVFEVYTDTTVDGGLKIAETSSFTLCLQACSFLSGVCAGMDYSESTQSCYIHTTASECSTPVDMANTIHIRLMSC